MPHDLRKIRKKRGSRTQGYGRIGQHRKSASRGERKPGRHKHLWSWVLRYAPDYFGKTGFKSVRAKEQTTINLKDLEEIVLKLSKQKKGSKGAKISVDLTELGYDKLLGEGRITMPVSIKVSSYSRVAVRKIEEAGGEILSGKPTDKV